MSCRPHEPEVVASPLERAAKDPGFSLPQAPNVSGGDKAEVIVVVTGDRVRLAGDRFPVAKVPPDGRLGLVAEDKLDGFREEYFVTPLAQAIVGAPRPVLAADGGDVAVPEEEGISRSPSVVVAADAKTTYRVLAEVVSTASHAKKDDIGLAAQGKSGVVVMPLGYLRAPFGFENVVSERRVSGPEQRLLFQTATLIVIRHDGFVVRVGSTAVAPGCKGQGKGLTVPNDAGGARAFTGLRDCIARIREEAKDLGPVVWLGAEPDVDVGTLVATRDAIALDANKASLVEDIGLVKPVDPEVVQ
jgi:hypothetical protein